MNQKKVLEDIWKLVDGQASKSKIGSRNIPHHLRPHEKPILEKAIERGFMVLKPQDRPNLENIFYLYNEQLGQPTYIYRQSETFPTQLGLIKERLQKIRPKEYAGTRNHLEGAVTKLSPYITHGILPLCEVWDFSRENYTSSNKETEKISKDDHFFKELAWREYFQQVFNVHGTSITKLPGLKQAQERGRFEELPKNIFEAKTGIKTIDESIRNLYQSGYIHNHARMWIASVVCNVAQTSWKTGADWMFYHLLDGDIASNYLSWQWVAGSFSNKLYWANQTNINTYSPTKNSQNDTFLDHPYETLPEKEVPTELSERCKKIEYPTDLSVIKSDKVEDMPTLLYSIWHLDPFFRHQGHFEKKLPEAFTQHQKVLLLEPGFFEAFPMSPNRISFILGLAQNIEGLKILVMDFEKINKYISHKNLTFINHKSLEHWENSSSTELQPPYLFPEVCDYYPSFFKYWNKITKTSRFKND